MKSFASNQNFQIIKEINFAENLVFNFRTFNFDLSKRIARYKIENIVIKIKNKHDLNIKNY